MRREVEEPTIEEEFGYEQHPAWVLIGASRVSSSPPGAALFDSDIRHQHLVHVTLKRAVRKRDLNHDYKHGREVLFEIAMSEAQWASFVSSMNTGDGVPATLQFDATRDKDERHVPEVPYAPRLQVSMDEVHVAGVRMRDKVRKAFADYAEKKTASNLRSLQAAIDNMAPDLDFAAQSLSEHAENVVQRARADIEAFVVQKARQLGIEPGEVSDMQLLGPGEDE